MANYRNNPDNTAQSGNDTLHNKPNKDSFYNLEDEELTQHPESDSVNTENEKDCFNDKNETGLRLQPNPEPIAMLLRVMVNPNNGWRAYKASKFKSSAVERKCFYPLAAVAAAGKFFSKLYSPDMPLSQILVEAIVTFMSFFFGYFIVMLLMKIFFGVSTREKMESEFGKNYILLGLSCEALFSFLISALQFIEPVLVFLPIYTIYLLSKGVKFLRVPKESETVTTSICALLVVGVPILLDWLFTLILPSTI